MVKYIGNGILQARNDFEPMALGKKNVVGVGIGYKISNGKKTKELAVVAMVDKKESKTALNGNDILPKSVAGTPTDVIEVGRIEALVSRTAKHRPAPGGVSIGHYMITAGTLGVAVTDNKSGAKVALSNNHVLANSNDADYGDPIYQPGPIDGGGVSDKIATLLRYAPIYFGEDEPTCDLAEAYVRFGNWISSLAGASHKVSAKKYNPQAVNLVDAAIAMPLTQDLLDDHIIDIGQVFGVADGYLGMKVVKSGRTTGTTRGSITLINATVDVNYGPNKLARFTDQFISGPMSAGGDSGSLLVTDTNEPHAVGLLFAGSNATTIYNPIKYVLSFLDITI